MKRICLITILCITVALTGPVAAKTIFIGRSLRIGHGVGKRGEAFGGIAPEPHFIARNDRPDASITCRASPVGG